MWVVGNLKIGFHQQLYNEFGSILYSTYPSLGQSYFSSSYGEKVCFGPICWETSCRRLCVRLHWMMRRCQQSSKDCAARRVWEDSLSTVWLWYNGYNFGVSWWFVPRQTWIDNQQSSNDCAARKFWEWGLAGSEKIVWARSINLWEKLDQSVWQSI